MKCTPGVGGRYRISVHAIESPNTATRRSPGAPGRGGGATSTGTSGATSAAESTSGPGTGAWGVALIGTIVNATIAAVAAEAMELLGEHERIAVALSPDGPRGPRMRAQPGVATVSAAMGVPVMPFAYSTNRGFVAGSWDSFFVPLPFGRGVKVWGPVIEPPEDRSPEGIEAHRLQIEQALTRITQDADRRMGRAPVEPAAPGARR